MSQAEEYQHHHSYRSSWLAPAPASLTPHDTSAFEGGADYFGMVDFDSGRRQPFYSLDDSFEDRGTPVNGIYARDGLWDEEDDSEVLSSAPGTSSKGRSGTASVNTSGPSRAGSSVTPSTARSSMRIRSRSGTVSSAKGKDVDEGDKGMWGWARRGRPSDPPAPAVTATVTVEKKVKKRDSKGLLKGKGRRGELTVQVDNEEVCRFTLDMEDRLMPRQTSHLFLVHLHHIFEHPTLALLSSFPPHHPPYVWAKTAQ